MTIVVAAALTLGPLVSLYRWTTYVFRRQTAAEYDAETFGAYGRGPRSFNAIAEYVREHTTATDRVLVWGSVQGINFLSGRPPATRFGEIRPLTAAGASAFVPRYRQEFLAAIASNPPAYIVALREGSCRIMVPSGFDAADHLARPMNCLSELPELEALAKRQYRAEREFWPFVVWRRIGPSR